MLDTSYGFNNLLKEVHSFLKSGSQALLGIRIGGAQEHQRLQGNLRQSQKVTRAQWYKLHKHI